MRDEVTTKPQLARLGLAVFALVALAFVALWVSPSGPTETFEVRSALSAQPDDGTVTMTLLHNNDAESKLLPDPDAGFPGIARFASAWIDLGQASDADILLRVSAGDNFLASKELAVSLDREDQPPYDAIAMRGLYEVIALGNHDFDFGPEVTARFIDGFRLSDEHPQVAFVAANLDVSAEPALDALVQERRLSRSTVYTDPVSGLDVGVIGAITPRLPNISTPRNVVVDPDVAAAVNAEVQSLAAIGVDRIVLVSHLQGLGEDRELIAQLSGVDVVVAGGGDELLRNQNDSCQADDEPVGPYPARVTDADGNEVALVTAPGGFRCIGRLDVTFDQDGNVIAAQGASVGVPVDGDGEEFGRSKVEEPLADAIDELRSTVIGESDVVLDGRRASVRTGPTNAGELLADAVLAAAQATPEFGSLVPVIAVQNAGGIRNDAEIQAGEISAADTFDIAPFANFVVSGEVPRSTLKDLLEVAVAGLPAAEGTFPQIAGFSMEIDAAQPTREVDRDGDCALVGDTGSRVRSVVLDDGTPIVVDGEVVDGAPVPLATIDFLASGGDCYPLADLEFTPVGASYQQALRTFIADQLGGQILADDYPEGGARTTILNADAASADSPPEDTATGNAESGASDTEASDAEATDAEAEADDAEASDAETEADDAEASDADSDAGTSEAGDAENAEADDASASAQNDSETDSGDAGDELPRTGLETWRFVILAATAALGGFLVYVEAQRAGRISLTNRLRATQAWIPDVNRPTPPEQLDQAQSAANQPNHEPPVAE